MRVFLSNRDNPGQNCDAALTQDSVFESALLPSQIPDSEALFANSPDLTFSRLSPQRNKVLLFLWQGQSNKQSAVQLAISPYTVGKHARNILRKLGVGKRTQVVAYTSFEGSGNIACK